MDPLAEILNAEGGLAKMLEGERAKAAAWLADRRRALDRAAQSEIERLKAASAEAQAAMRQAAAERSATIATSALALADRIRRLDDERLARIVWEHLQSIVPGPGRDRQNVQD